MQNLPFAGKQTGGFFVSFTSVLFHLTKKSDYARANKTGALKDARTFLLIFSLCLFCGFLLFGFSAFALSL